MRRSEINAILADAVGFLAERSFLLPAWAHWSPDDWRNRGSECREIVDNQLGWDITDFGSGVFERCGLVLFTLRNGTPGRYPKPYAEKIMIVREGQVTPLHFHRIKMEDIINRGGGELTLELFHSTPDGHLGDQPVRVAIDGLTREAAPGEVVRLLPGDSICLPPYLYHRFYAAPGKGAVLAGEVSMVNDDVADNRFFETAGRFPAIEEDESPRHLLISDYQDYL